MIDLTDENVVAELLKRAVAEKGADYVYPNANEDGEGCVYFDVRTGSPSCIVGHVLAYQGIKREDLLQYSRCYDEEDGIPEDYNEYHPVPDLAFADIIKVSDKTADMLYDAQKAQDTGKTWGESIEKAGVK